MSHEHQMGGESLKIIGVNKTFTDNRGGEVRALSDITLEIEAGEFFVLLGPSGCGKTTLLRSIAGFEFPDSGQIELGSQRIDALPPFQRPVNTVFQSYALFPHMTVAENVAFGLQMQGLNKKSSELRDRVNEVLELVELSAFKNRKPQQLSGGQQQRVAMARALAKKPKVLLLDEPLSALDYKLRRQMQVELKRLQQTTGVTFVLVTHDQEEALSMADRIAVFSSGRIDQVGTPERIYSHPENEFVANFVGEMNLLRGTGHAAGVTLSGGIELSKIHLADPDLVTQSGKAEQFFGFRSEDVQLDRQGMFHGTVEAIEFLGAGSRVTISLGPAGSVIARLDRDTEAPQIGETLTFSIKPGRVLGLRS